MKNIILIKDAVREVLEECPKSRNSDKLLILLVFKKLGFEMFIDDIKNSPSFESITRWRRKFQNTMGYCTPEEDIDALRNRRELEYREVFA